MWRIAQASRRPRNANLAHLRPVSLGPWRRCPPCPMGAHRAAARASPRPKRDRSNRFYLVGKCSRRTGMPRSLGVPDRPDRPSAGRNEKAKRRPRPQSCGCSDLTPSAPIDLRSQSETGHSCSFAAYWAPVRFRRNLAIAKGVDPVGPQQSRPRTSGIRDQRTETGAQRADVGGAYSAAFCAWAASCWRWSSSQPR